MTKLRPYVLVVVVLLGVGCATVEGGPESLQPDLSVPPRHGFVRLGSSSVKSGSDTFEQSMVKAVFYDPTAPVPMCVRQETGPCWLYKCSDQNGALSAGEIRVVAGTDQVVLKPEPQGYADFRTTSSLLFKQGQVLTVQAAGDAVPAWQTLFEMPSHQFSLKTPNPARVDLAWLISKTQGLAFTWTPLAEQSTVRLELSQQIGQGQSLLAVCSFDGSLGAGLVPPFVLGQFQTTPGAKNALGVLVGPANETKVALEGWDFAVSSIGVGRTGLALLSD